MNETDPSSEVGPISAMDPIPELRIAGYRLGVPLPRSPVLATEHTPGALKEIGPMVAYRTLRLRLQELHIHRVHEVIRGVRVMSAPAEEAQQLRLIRTIDPIEKTRPRVVWRHLGAVGHSTVASLFGSPIKK